MGRCAGETTHAMKTGTWVGGGYLGKRLILY